MYGFSFAFFETLFLGVTPFIRTFVAHMNFCAFTICYIDMNINIVRLMCIYQIKLIKQLEYTYIGDPRHNKSNFACKFDNGMLDEWT